MPECEKTGGCRYEARIVLLEEAVKDLESGQGREETFRKTYYKDREDRIRRDAELDAQIKVMDEKLDKLVTRKEEEDARPRKRWDGMVDKIVWAVLAAVVAFLLGRMGL